MRTEIRMEDFRKINSARFLYSRFRDLFVFVLRHATQILLVSTVALLILETYVSEA